MDDQEAPPGRKPRRLRDKRSNDITDKVNQIEMEMPTARTAENQTYANTQEVNVKTNAIGDLNDSAEQQLHPLRDSTWAEIFPILSYFTALKSDQAIFEEAKADKEFHKRRAKSIKFLKNEAFIIQNQRKSYLQGTESNVFKDIDLSSIGSHKQLPKEYQRTFWEKISEFNDPQRVLGSGISSYH